VAVSRRRCRHDLSTDSGTVGDPAGSDHHVEGRQGVAPNPGCTVVDRGVVEGEPSVVANPPDVVAARSPRKNSK
jgi:hypothetical protein